MCQTCHDKYDSLSAKAAFTQNIYNFLTKHKKISGISGPRSLAAFKIASQLPSRAPSAAADMVAAAFSSQLALKSRFKGELQGLQSKGSYKGEGYVSPFKAAISSYLTGESLLDCWFHCWT